MNKKIIAKYTIELVEEGDYSYFKVFQNGKILDTACWSGMRRFLKSAGLPRGKVIEITVSNSPISLASKSLFFKLDEFNDGLYWGNTKKTVSLLDFYLPALEKRLKKCEPNRVFVTAKKIE